MATIGNLFVGVSADTTGLEQGMRRGAQATQQGAQQMAQSMLRVNGALNSTVMIASQMGLDTRIAMPMGGAAHVATDLAPKLAMELATRAIAPSIAFAAPAESASSRANQSISGSSSVVLSR